MMNKMYLFIITSIILGLIISYYYNNNFDKIFISMFIMITIIFFILFYFLGNKENIEYERFSNQTHQLMTNIENEHFNLQQLHGVLNEIDTEEENMHHVIHPEEEQMHHVIHPEEEEHTHHVIHPEKEKHKHHTKHHNKYPITLVPTDDKDKTSKDISEGYGPISINISYNAQNSTNNLSDGIHESDTNNSTKSPDTNNKDKDKDRKSKNLGPIHNDSSRIHNNSDWVYGSNAWTNDPDYYIPTKNCPSTIVPVDPKPLNELAMRKLEGNNEACPIEVNVPWSQWKSGDSDPEPFNL